MKKVAHDPGLVLARQRWQFFERLFGALRSSGRRLMEQSLQGAVEQQVAAVRGEQGGKLLLACPGCGSMDRADFLKNGYYRRRLGTTEGFVELRVPRLRCRCGKSLPVEHLGFGRRQRYSYDFQLAVVEQVGLRSPLRGIAAAFARRAASRSHQPRSHGWSSGWNCPPSARCHSHHPRSASTRCMYISGTRNGHGAGQAAPPASSSPSTMTCASAKRSSGWSSHLPRPRKAIAAWLTFSSTGVWMRTRRWSSSPTAPRSSQRRSVVASPMSAFSVASGISQRRYVSSPRPRRRKRWCPPHGGFCAHPTSSMR